MNQHPSFHGSSNQKQSDQLKSRRIAPNGQQIKQMWKESKSVNYKFEDID